MEYITGIYALNLPCSLNTTGDWHTSALQWNNPYIKNSEDSIFENYGIEVEKEIPEHKIKYNVANHIRAILDMLEEGDFSNAQGMKNDFICVEEYDDEIFYMVKKLKEKENWEKINQFMHKEYGRRWRKWITGD